MNTKLLMMASAGLMGIIGIILTFLPEETANYIGLTTTAFGFIFIQILGALYFAFALLNWMARANIIGGIYSKPVAMGNFAHFFIAGISLLKSAFSHQTVILLWGLAIIYSIFAILFAIVAFGNPIKNN